MIATIITQLLGALAVAAAMMVVLSKHPVRSVLYLVVTFFFISGLYIMMNAQFLAIVNIIVYAGAIMVLFLFVLMLLNLNKDAEPKTPTIIWIISTVAGGILFLVLIAALKDIVLVSQKTLETPYLQNLSFRLKFQASCSFLQWLEQSCLRNAINQQ